MCGAGEQCYAPGLGGMQRQETSMFQTFGAATGPLFVYLHGSPGGPAECAHFDGLARAAGVRLACLDRGRVELSLSGEAYFRAVAQAIDGLAGAEPFSLIGFSMGTFVALRAAPYLTSKVIATHLISSAAPLESGDFLNHMVGKAVFQMAQSSPDALRRLTRVQGWMTRFLPGLMIGALFNGAKGGDLALATDKAFRKWIARILAETTGPGEAGYLRDIGAYVTPWAEHLKAVPLPCQLWHGDEDNWTPPGMATVLSHLLPQISPIHRVAGASHYSTLIHAMPLILGGKAD